MARAGTNLQLDLPTQLGEKTFEMPLGQEKYRYLSGENYFLSCFVVIHTTSFPPWQSFCEALATRYQCSFPK